MREFVIKDAASLAEVSAFVRNHGDSQNLGEGIQAKIDATREIVNAVRKNGDTALAEFTERFDGVALTPDQFEVMPEEIDARPGSIGRGIPGVRLQVLGENRQPVAPGEVGEIVAQGENIMLGYWNDPIETSQVLRPEGLCTGDLARRDADGYVYIVGRKSDMIKSGAYRINPKEIEDVILELPHVAEVAVVGMPDEILGERLVAFVVPSGNGKSHTDGQIVNHCRGNLPRYKLVREIRFLDSLPKTSSGKIRRHELLHGLTQELDSLAKKA